MYQNEANQDLREKMEAAKITHWQVAAKIGISPNTMSVWMRIPLQKMDPRRTKILCGITALEKEAERAKNGKTENEKSVCGH